MLRNLLSILRATVLATLAVLLLLLAVLVLPAYSAFMIIWLNVPPGQVLPVTGIAALMALVAAVGVATLVRRKRPVRP